LFGFETREKSNKITGIIHKKGETLLGKKKRGKGFSFLRINLKSGGLGDARSRGKKKKKRKRESVRRKKEIRDSQHAVLSGSCLKDGVEKKNEP